MGATPPYSGTQPRRAGTATPLGLHRPLDRSLEDKILRAHTPNRVSFRQPTTYVASLKDPCASSSTDKVAVRMFLSLPATVPPLTFRQPLYPHLSRQYLKGQLKAPPEFQLPRSWQTEKAATRKKHFAPRIHAN